MGSMNLKFGRNILRLDPSKRPLKILETRRRGRIQKLPNFLGTPIISGTGKAKNFKLCRHIHRITRNKSPLKISGKVTVGVLRDSRKFSGHAPIYRAHRAVIFAIAQLSCLKTVSPQEEEKEQQQQQRSVAIKCHQFVI